MRPLQGNIIREACKQDADPVRGLRAKQVNELLLLRTFIASILILPNTLLGVFVSPLIEFREHLH
jgi:hypothetical protein